jgi:hypothetical protein
VNAGDLLARVGAVRARLREHARRPPSPGLTAPDPPSGERWDWGQVWAHLAEFIPYWMDQVRLALGAAGEAPMAFGRVKSDPERVAAIERDRHRPVAELMERLEGQLDDLDRMIESVSPKALSGKVAHSTLGVMDLREAVDEFLVGHLEQHADQLDELAGLTRQAGS